VSSRREKVSDLYFSPIIRTQDGGLFDQALMIEVDMGTLAVHPLLPGMQEMLGVIEYSIRSGGGEPCAGRCLVAWAREAGFRRESINVTGTIAVSSTLEERRIVGTQHLDRMLASDVISRAEEAGIATREDFEAMTAAWKEWVVDEDGFFSLSETEIVCRKEAS
jgi:hypothetical protein